MFALAVATLGVFLLGGRNAEHAADLLVAGQPRSKNAHHAFCIEPIGLGTTRAPVHQDAGRLEHVSCDPLRRQHPMQPDPVAPGLKTARHIGAPQLSGYTGS